MVNGVPVNKFVGLEEVEHSTAGGVLAAIDSCLKKRVGVLIRTQKEKLVNNNLDGVAVNMGIYNGVGAMQQLRCGGQVTVTHCVNHNLELALMDLRKEEPYLDIFEKTLKVLFIIYQFYCAFKLINISVAINIIIVIYLLYKLLVRFIALLSFIYLIWAKSITWKTIKLSLFYDSFFK